MDEATTGDREGDDDSVVLRSSPDHEPVAYAALLMPAAHSSCRGTAVSRVAGSALPLRQPQPSALISLDH